MRRKSYLVLHKSEWDRLHRRKDDAHQFKDQREAYFKKLVEISQGWIKTWPDTVQGYVEQVQKDKEKQHEEGIEFVKSLLRKKKREGTKEAIKKAKQQIFDKSSDGRQLLSALIESKVLEERDLQIKFQKEINQKAHILEKEALSKFNLNQNNLNKQKEEDRLKKKEMEIELGKINKSIYEMAITKKVNEKEEQAKLELEDARLMQELLEVEQRREKKYEDQLREGADIFEKEQKLAKLRRAERDKRDEAIAKGQRQELDKRYCKIRRVMKEMHHDRQSSGHFKRNYELIKAMQDEAEARYANFVQGGIKEVEKRTLKKDQEDSQKQKLERNRLTIMMEINKTRAETAVQLRHDMKTFNCCVSDRQSILPKSRYGRKKNINSAVEDKQLTTFLEPAKKLKEQLEARKKEPSPWSGTRAAHAQFATQASKILQEVRYKHPVRKVIDEYRKKNCLDATTLPVSNYDEF